MNKNVEDILRDVRTAIDEIALNNSDFFGGSDNLEFDEIFRQKLAEAVDFVHGNANANLVDFGDTSVKSKELTKGASVDVGSISTGFEYRIKKPDNFLRFIQGIMDCWSEYVTETIDAGDPDYRKVQDEYSGASVLRPAILWDGRQFRFIKGTSDTHKATVLYFERCSYDPNSTTPAESIEINKALYTALVYYLSGLVLMTYGEQRADDMFNMAMTHMGVATKA